MPERASARVPVLYVPYRQMKLQPHTTRYTRVVARATVWHHAFEQLADGLTIAGYHAVQLMDPLTDGQTLVRIRFRYQCVHPQKFGAQESTGLGVAMGIALLPRFVIPGETLFPVTNANVGDWIWWEAPFYTPVLGADTDGKVVEADIAPYPDQYRDCKAMRRVVGDQTLWLVTQTTSVGAAQTDHYLSVSSSTLVLDPA